MPSLTCCPRRIEKRKEIGDDLTWALTKWAGASAPAQPGFGQTLSLSGSLPLRSRVSL